MPGIHSINKCIAYIGSESIDHQELKKSSTPAITLSRKTGARGHAIAESLVERLQHSPYTRDKSGVPWCLIDRDLVEKSLEEHKLDRRLARYLPEDRGNLIMETVGEIVGLHPPLWTLHQYTEETLRKYAERGNVVMVGRGSHIVTREFPNTVHIRITGSTEYCCSEVKRRLVCRTAEARRFIESEEKAKRRYVRSHYGEDPENPCLYHMVLNTDQLTDNQAVNIIYRLIREKFGRKRKSPLQFVTARRKQLP